MGSLTHWHMVYRSKWENFSVWLECKETAIKHGTWVYDPGGSEQYPPKYLRQFFMWLSQPHTILCFVVYDMLASAYVANESIRYITGSLITRHGLELLGAWFQWPLAVSTLSASKSGCGQDWPTSCTIFSLSSKNSCCPLSVSGRLCQNSSLIREVMYLISFCGCQTLTLSGDNSP